MSRRRPGLKLQVGAVAGAGLCATCVLALTAPGWPLPVPIGRTTAPGLHGGLVRQWAFYMALTVLTLSWLGLVHLARTLPGGRRVRLVAVWVIGALWAVPLLAAPPLQSRDAYSYVAQGEMAARGLDPSQLGPSALGDPEFTDRVSLNWTDSPAPYGPTAFGAGAMLAVLTGHGPDGMLAGTKLLAFAGVLLAGACVPVIARRHGAAPATAVALGVANPVVLLHLVGGAHHEALMLGLVCASFALRARDRRVLAILIASLAAAVKPTALVAVFYLGWDWLPQPSLRWRRTLAGAGAIVAALAVYALAGLVTGTGWGLVGASASSAAVTTDLSLPQVGAMLLDPVPSGRLLSWIRMGWAGLAVGCGVLVWFFAARIGAVCATALTLLVLALGAPVLYPWYPTVALGLLAALPQGRWRPAFVIGVMTLTFAMHPGGGSVLSEAGGARPLLAALYWLPLLAGVAYAVWPVLLARVARTVRRADA